jgi:hypothetical protein
MNVCRYCTRETGTSGIVSRARAPASRIAGDRRRRPSSR